MLVSSKNFPMQTIKTPVALIPLVTALLLAGCEALGPEAIKRTPIPPNLRIEQVQRKDLDSRPIHSEPLGTKPKLPPEYYPANGNLLGKGGTTIAAAPPAAAQSCRHP